MNSISCFWTNLLKERIKSEISEITNQMVDGILNFLTSNNYNKYISLVSEIEENSRKLIAKIIKTECYRKYNKGFYVHAPKKDFKNLKDGIEYVTRYYGRTPISENRILNYDGKNVTFCYNAHEDGKYHEVTITAKEFIKILPNHIIPIGFKVVRYYGFYRKKHILHNKMFMLVSKEKKTIRKSFLKHELSVLRSFKRNPYNCPKCDVRMNYVVLLI